MPEEMRVDEGGGREGVKRVDYPSNARRTRENPPEEKKVEAVVTSEVIRRKRSPFAKLAHGFLAEDSGSVVEYVLQEVLLPAARSMIYDMFTQGLERKLFGDSRPRSPAQRTGYTNYSTRSTASTGARHIPGSNVTSLSRQQRATHDFADIIVATRGEAEDVLDRLRDLIVEYQVATVSDFFDLVNLTGEFTDDKWGWFDLRSASIRPVRGGYMFHLPKTQPIT